MTDASLAQLQRDCAQLRSLHMPGDPLLLPNVWDAATARAVVSAGLPVVATTSWGVALSLGYDDHEHAPANEMLAAAARIARAVDVPVTVDAEAGYGMEPGAVVAALQEVGAAGCNLEDTDHGTGAVRDPGEQAKWLAAVRDAATAADYPLVVNARVDVFLGPYIAGTEPGSQTDLVPEAIERANAYLDAGADCVYPIALCERDALTQFMSAIDAPVNVARMPGLPSLADVRTLGVARVSWAIGLFEQAMANFREQLASLRS